MPEVRSSAEYIPLNCSRGHPGDGGLAARKGMTLYVKKYFVGIDVAKLKHTASASTPTAMPPPPVRPGQRLLGIDSMIWRVNGVGKCAS